MNNDEPIKPWHKQPWFWFLLIFPGAAIIWCISMITVALSIDSSMVTDDYSKQGRGIAMDRVRDETARSMGLEANLDFDDRSAVLTINADNGSAEYPYLILNQFRPRGEGRYTASLNESLDGRWYLDLRGPDNDWRLKGEATLPHSRDLILGGGTDNRG